MAFNITHHRRAHRHERSRHRRQYRDEEGRPFLLVGGAGSESGPWSPWSEPSPCSRTCGGGVSYQERRCNVETACTGAPKRYFSCNIEDCPEGSADFRAEQCAAYNDVEFEGQTYDWIPYTKAQNKCQLNCMPRGERFYYRHEEKVHDGTLCKADSLDICVDGECMPVGCDRLLGSTTKEDACRVCGGNGSTCATTSGVLDNDDLIAGYNDLLLIPEGATNIKISERKPSNNYLAIRNRTGHYYLNGNWRIDFPRSLHFAGTVFTYSREPFGFYAPESITALGPTNEAIFIVLLYQERNPGIEYIYSVPKGTVHETSPQGYGWQYGEWTPCNTTCGSGYQTREIWCAQRRDATQVTNDLCDPSTIPADTQQCSLAACPPTWTTGPWGPCSVSCGAKGTQIRQVYCTQDDGSGRSTLFEDDAECVNAGPKPETTRACEEAAVCPSLHIGPWKPCDRLCGNGKQKRDIHCYYKVEGKIKTLPIQNCGEQVPESEKACNLRPCEGLDWITGEWSGCEDKCGLAIETRTAYCGNQKGSSFPDSLCHAYRKPQLVRNCTYTPCASQWYTSQWSACSSKCGTGVQTRSVFCAAFEGDLLKKVDDSKCDPDQKYEDKQECKVEGECKGEWFYGPYSSCSKPCGGGIMMRKMLCVKNNVTVDIKECSMDTIGSTTAECNKQPCGEDEIMPVEPTQIISEEYSEECEGDYYDYEDVTEDSFIKVDSSLETSSEGGLSLAGKDVTEITGISEDDEGSGGFSDDLITVSSSKQPLNESSTASPEISPSTIASSSLPSSLSPESSSALASSVSAETLSESTTLSSLLTSLISDITSSTFFSSTSNPVSGSDSSVSSLSPTSSPDVSSADTKSPSPSEPTGDASSVSLNDITLNDAVTFSVDGSSSGVSLEKLILPTESSLSSSSATEATTSDSSTVGSTDSSSISEIMSTLVSSDQSSTEPTTDQTSTDSSSSDVTEASSSQSTEITMESSTSPDVSESDASTFATSESSKDSSSESSSSARSTGTDLSETSSSSENTSEFSSPAVSVSESSTGSSPIEASSTILSSTLAASSEASVSESSTFGSSVATSSSPESSTELSSSSPEVSTPLISESSSSEEMTSVATSTIGEVSSTVSDLLTSERHSSIISETDSSTIGISSSSEITDSSAASTSLESSTSQTLDQETSSSEVPALTSISPSSMLTDEDEDKETSEAEKTSYTEAVFSYTTPSSIEKAIKKEQKMKKCKRRSKQSKCMKSEFGCCPDNKTPAKGPFGKDCPMPKTCLESEFGCCPDEVSPAQGPNGKGCPPSYCEQTLFGCCQDAITPAEGNDFEGCPVELTTFIADCSSSEYGCCPDGILSASGPNMQGCAGCNETEYGCCPDEQTAATGPDFFGCDVEGTSEGWSTSTETTVTETTLECENTTYGCCPDNVSIALGDGYLGCFCSETEFGCCPDGNSTATGPNFAGCPAACAGGEFGCCDDNVTLAHGPNKTGCCLLTPHGCCPDNIVPARGPNFEGCGCQYSPYGCCPDNQTAARGPDNEGCGCQYTTHGCCPNNYTPAAGPDFQGCPCHTFQFGCCPDGIRTAVGPRHQGCGCEDTEFGCCSDGRTPAPDSSKNCSCAASKYGCCLDGVTEAQGENYEGCETKLVYKGEYCSLPKQLGECRNLTIKWYFDMEYGGCSRFWYGGCGGNGNRFNSATECKETCVEPTGKDKCYLPKIEGPCKSYYPRWYYDKERKACTQFIYSGCLGNANKFETKEECDELCAIPNLDACDQKVDSGPCAGNYTRWYFDKNSQVCSPFQYGGCKGTENNFLSESACQVKCLQPGKSRVEEICSSRRETGPCRKYIVMWYFDKRLQRCKQFFYGGCEGNENRFKTEVECESFCLKSKIDIFPKTQTYKPEECSLPREKGTCGEKLPKWYFDYSENKCLPFHYSGCDGNENNFDSRDECEQACPPRIELDTCILPAVEGECSNYTQRFFYDVLEKQCKLFYYGGCGGNSNNFNTMLECQQRCDPKSLPKETPIQFTKDMCFLPSEAGSCSDSQIKWFYNSQDGICKQFRYSGCGGNGNRFETRNDCFYSCGDVQDVCTLPRVVGPCNGNFRQWHYDQATQSCQAFDYGGCQGNNNRFDSEEECRKQCVKTKEVEQPPAPIYEDICHLSVDPGPCLNQQIPLWFYDPASGSCLQFMYGGCEGNANRFVSEEQCERQCGTFKGQDVCSGVNEVGQCDNHVQKYYFDVASGSCSEFSYSGCGGNPNRFSTLNECELLCLHNKEPPIPTDESSPAVNQAICNQPIEVGFCSRSHKRWYYETRKNGCAPFIYSGCGGNLNNFESFQECNHFCLPSPRKPSANEIDVDESKKEHCAEIERRCSLLNHCRYGLERWVDAAGCSACRCHEPCLTSPPDCPPAQSCQVELITNSETGYTEYRGVCRPDTKPGVCPTFTSSETCDQECRKDSECPGDFKCCYNGCGTVCTAPRSEIPVTREPPHFPESTAEAPRISQETPSEEVSQEGNYATFNCIAHGRPSPSVMWYRGENLLDVNDSGGGRYRILKNGTLQVIGLEKTDSGLYTCRASNGIQPDASRDYTLTVTDGVKRDAAVVGEENTDMVVDIDKPAVLTCYAIGWPRPSVTWWQGSSMLPLASESLEQRRDNTLLIRRVTLQSLGFYTCQAYNGQGKAASWTVALKVFGPITLRDPNDITYNQFVLPARVLPIPDTRPRQPPYSILPITQAPLPQPPVPQTPPVPVRANISSTTQDLRAGSNVNLTCAVKGDPIPRVTWYKNNVPITPTNRMHVIGEVLSLHDIHVEDSGEYKCVADNGYTSAETSVQLNVQGIRIPPGCTDSPFLANCTLIIKARFCNHKFYAKFCCQSCTEAGQLPPWTGDDLYAPSRKRRFVPEKMFRITP